ncbi:MAG: 4Fe-4S dicluster domain-containing protein [Nanoarchaeota archaeon]|nr:4Fe-4S dicluster domain-containing protein [Nanoarchaeota archaeon]MBU1030640.1 4Fe-4S dicluster domain-containing protein [Nanoarchaeota archaeon]MBU1849842.1 4Fe-4S dicluster domain-containing protein [Nanoarchaeota archaeon]
MGKILDKKDLKCFFEKLQKIGEVVAPVKNENISFKPVKKFSEVCFEGRSMFPIKKYFLPTKEAIAEIKNDAFVEKNDFKKRIIFGARLCDLNGLLVLDKLFLDPLYPDKIYAIRRENTILIGFACKEPLSDFCFCESMDLKDYYDLLITENNEKYYVSIGSKKGANLVTEYKDYDINLKKPVCKKKLKNKNIHDFFDEKFWEKDALKCVSCQRCTLLCPTCLCFDVADEMNIDLKLGTRNRSLDSCHSKDFTLVAGGHVFRDTKLKRYRHRVFHKIQYFKDKFEIPMCVGCGRCMEFCHSKIDFVDTINNLKK